MKFQGDTDFAAQDASAAIPGRRLMHLAHNKHDLTFAWAREDGIPLRMDNSLLT